LTLPIPSASNPPDLTSDPERSDPTRRFTDRVDDYARYRPSYPPGLMQLLRDEAGLRPEHVVADVGSGTGLLTEPFLRNGNVVFAVEPNRAMAAAARERLGGDHRFRDVDGRAEATGLDPASVDFIVVGQAFHWFDAARARDEFRRILRPGGFVVLAWNARRVEGSAFLRDYEAFLRRWGTDYKEVSARYEEEGAIRTLFGDGGFGTRTFDNVQTFDLAGLRGRLCSSSYAPPAGDPRHEPMLLALADLFAAHQQRGHVAFEYDTHVYWGRLPTGAGVS
jgi:SAM-dependent methyltransferase